MSSKWKLKKDVSMKKHTSLDSKKKNIFKKITLTVALLSLVTFNLAFANGEESDNSINKIYHVYLGDTYIGPVTNEESVTEIVEQKEKEASLQYENMEVDASSDVSLVPEHVFSFEIDDTNTLEKLNTELEVQTPAFAMKIDEEPVAYFKSEQDYEEAIHQLKLEYVTEKELQQLENNVSKELAKNESRLLEVSVVENLAIENTKVNPEQILTPEKAVDYLKTGSVEQELYAVQNGDVLGKIAKKHNLSVAELLKLNPDINENTILQIGQKLNVTVEKPLVNVKVVYEKSRVEKIDFTKIVEENDSMYKGEKIVKQEGEYGKKKVEYIITELNGKRVEKAVTEETVLSEPSDRVVVVGTKVVSDRGTGAFAWPTSGGYISSNMGNRWGEFHRGIDIARPSNYNITASDNGVVTFAGWDGTYGQKIVVDHNNGYETLYAHLSEIKVTVGQVVPQGSIIGIMGSTGNSTGTHLHFEVHKNGSYVNPLTLLD
ncbi:M23 family metallopeptidase [Lysinibacillus endophyticus]|uniref:M23 family metallopeptidase n=1 Tax=Ureibacillus endophyticus TaxID=1978490 RepID=A0A494Z1Q3_9BACL|nr:M23 family metallopeptidase [Lysinibacillus endophyticus]MCP1146601.1 M23 family metallopeptidase [Lysinibacillus endophyticus]RKQ16458.1 M23 family metallopeptidase [Lysinibacillus endophyticus]